MTKKHFENIARIIHDNMSLDIPNVIVLNDFMDDICEYFAQLNPDFDKDKFVIACYECSHTGN